MKEEIVIFLKRFGGYIVAFFVIGFWVWSIATGRMSDKPAGESGGFTESPGTNNPRTSLKRDTLKYRDSTFILSTKIDTVFKTPGK